MKDHKLYLEDVQNMNSDKEIKLKQYQEILNTYKSKKGSFKSILATKPEEKWEEESSKIIDTNPYLGTQWKLDKIENKIKNDEERLKGDEVTDEETKEIQQTINDNKKKLKEEENELTKKIRTDLATIQSL